jgi:acyl-CoA synthetase (AMP-forming)/AMP-acid ligase II
VDENLKMVPRGVKGEILTKGYSVMRGYWGDDAKTKEVRAKGKYPPPAPHPYFLCANFAFAIVQRWAHTL